MSLIDITFTTPTYQKFRWLDGLETLEEEEIEDLILILRGALSAFSAELTDRRQPWTDQSFEEYKKLLEDTAQQINVQGLTTKHEKYLQSLKSFLVQAQEENKISKALRQYLWLISKVIG